MLASRTGRRGGLNEWSPWRSPPIRRPWRMLAGGRQMARRRVSGENDLGSGRSQSPSQDGVPSLFSRHRDERFDIGMAFAS